MKRTLLVFCFLLVPYLLFSQREHLGWYRVNSPLYKMRRAVFPSRIANQDPGLCPERTFASIASAADLLFLGDSLTEYGMWEKAFPNRRVVNFGVSGDCVQCLNLRLPEFLKVQAKEVFLMIGHNDLRKGRTPEMVIPHLKKSLEMIRKLAPQARLTVQSVLPIRRSDFVEAYTDNETIRVLNEKIENVCKSSGIRYLNLFPHFVDAEGELKKEYSSDGAHITVPGLRVWEDLLRTFTAEKLI